MREAVSNSASSPASPGIFLHRHRFGLALLRKLIDRPFLVDVNPFLSVYFGDRTSEQRLYLGFFGLPDRIPEFSRGRFRRLGGTPFAEHAEEPFPVRQPGGYLSFGYFALSVH